MLFSDFFCPADDPVHINWYYHSIQMFLPFIGREPTSWPVNNCLQIMVCSCAMSFNCFWLQILFCSCVNETTLFSFLRSLLRENGRSLRFPKIFLKKQTRWSNYKTIIELGYRKTDRGLSVSRRSITCLSLRLRQIIDLISSDKSRYFAQRRPILANYYVQKAPEQYPADRKRPS